MSDLQIIPRRIEDYAIVGDCETAALIAINGSIDWLCWPRFDSGACFAALLGGSEHGRWLIAPKDETATRVTRRYLRSSLILVTTFENTTGAVELVDFMPPGDDGANLVRIVRGIRGRVSLRTEFILRFDYGSVVPWVEHLPDEGLRAIAGPEMVVLHTPVPLHGRDFISVAEFDVGAGENVPFILSYGLSHLPPPKGIHPERALRETEKYWGDWSDRCAPAGRWTEAAKRSLIVLKGLTYLPTGGIVAAPTTSLPEQGRRCAQLGLSLLLAEGRHLHPARVRHRWLLRRGPRLAGLVGACGCRPPGPVANYVWP